ncbi:MAG: redoxin domain-containing protein [Verrucomicrobia bacterium]|nr:redoxin domain-containing protein [Verrucomicrobiota bacterium]
MLAPKSLFLLTAFSLMLNPGHAAEDEQNPAKDPGVLPGHSAHGEAFNEGPRQKAYLMGGTGPVRFPVTTQSAEAQLFFNQGVGQLHGFWYFEAERSFRQVFALDTNCVMAYWGMAMANVNNPKRAKEFIKLASNRKAEAGPRERMWIEAYAKYWNAEADGKKDDSNDKNRRRELVRALERIAFEYPDDLEAKAFLAFQTWDNGGKGWPIPSHLTFASLIKDIVAAEPMHPAHHFMIHLWDNEDAKRALEAAARCGQGSPGIAHMWHMPGHTYSKVHRYADAAWQQEASARVDHAYLMKNGVLPDQIHNYAHNNQWLVEDLEYVGRVHEAVDLAKNMIELPRHPKYNTLTRTNNSGGYESRSGSASLGRDRLFETLLRFELWDELIALSDTPYLEPTDFRPEQIKRLRALGVAHFSKANAEMGRAQISALESLLKEQRQERQADAEKAEAKAKKEKKSEDDINKAMADALKTHADKIRAIENAVAELKGFEQFLNRKYGGAWETWGDLKDIPKERLARLRLVAGDKEKAEVLAFEAMKNGTNQVHVLAHYVDVLWQCGKEEKARLEFERLRALACDADLNVPVFQRLKPVAARLGWPEDWRWPAAQRTDVGHRPKLDSLGPFRWQPSPAPDWTLTAHDGNRHSLRDDRGKPVVVIFYLGYGCLHCIEQLNTFAPVARQFTEAGISLAAIGTDSVEGLKKTLEKSKAESGFPFPLFSDESLNVFKAYRAYDDFEKIPLHGTFLIDGEGLVRWQDISFEPFKDTEFLLAEAKRLLKIAAKPLVAAAASSQ